MKTSQGQGRWIKGFAVMFAVAASSLGAQAATVYCPGTSAWQSTATAPTSGRYLEVTNAAFPGRCFYQDDNLQVADYATVATAFGISPTSNFLLLDKNGEAGGAEVGALSPIAKDLKEGDWDLVPADIWSRYTSLYLGFHFGGGQGTPDSFVVQLQNGKMDGTWDFLPDEFDNGLSNYYLFGIAGDTPPPPPQCGGPGQPPCLIPEPGSMALVSLALLGLGATVARRRQV